MCRLDSPLLSLSLVSVDHFQIAHSVGPALEAWCVQAFRLERLADLAAYRPPAGPKAEARAELMAEARAEARTEPMAEPGAEPRAGPSAGQRVERWAEPRSDPGAEPRAEPRRAASGAIACAALSSE